jgi:antitoxin component YwqK of YwqJK toxin-antitoxin module
VSHRGDRLRETWLLGIAAALTCTLVVATSTASSVRREADDPALSRENGVLLASGAPFTGELVDRSPNGTLTSVFPYVDGLREGTARGWYADGSPAWVRGYVEGREEGRHEGWWENGAPRFRYAFEGGLLEGDLLEWFPDGTPYRAFHYVNGKEEGRQRMWYTDGAPRANYVIRDGRRYGLPGTKGCTGGDDSSEAGA